MPMPTLEELIAFFRAVTGREPTPEDVARTLAKIEADTRPPVVH